MAIRIVDLLLAILLPERGGFDDDVLDPVTDGKDVANVGCVPAIESCGTELQLEPETGSLSFQKASNIESSSSLK